MKIKTPHIKALVAVVCIALPGLAAQAAISLDRTRIIFDGDNKSVSLNIRNDNKEMPYLAQSWIENEQQQKVTAPIIVLPPLQRIEPDTGGQVKLLKTPEAEQLPKDRESLFYFNLREVPPRTDTSNTMQIALQTKIKLFYRPQEITPGRNIVWQERLLVSKASGGFHVENPTPYYVTIIDLQDVSDKKSESNFEPVMLAPFSSSTLEPEARNIKRPVISYINDYGGYQKLNYTCEQAQCSFKQTK